HERGRANSIYVAGILVALATAPLLVVPLAERLGWRASFALLGATGLLISLPLVAWFVSDTPSSSSSARVPLQAAPVATRVVAQGRVAPQVLVVYVAAGVCNAFCVFGVLNWLPSYLNRTRGIEFGDLSVPLFSVFLAGIVGVFFWAYVGDLTGRRVAFASAGLLVAGLCVVLTAFAPTNEWAIAFLALGVFLQSSFNAQEFATLQQMAPPERVGALTGLYNGMTVLLGGVGGSFIPGALTAATGDFQAGLLSVAVGAGLVSLLMAVLAYQMRAAARQVSS
ncbi:MAG: MFS transporter, partial [Armatimonadota bacterium]|nr:MFS transporter [Armatimonadota bacterium]